MELLGSLARRVSRAGEEEAATWQRDFDFAKFVGLHFDKSGEG